MTTRCSYLLKFSILLAIGASNNAALASDNTETLEARVWTAEDDALPSLEREIVRTMQLNPSSVEAHYLLAHTMVRMFASDPGNLQLLKQASELAQQALDLDPRSDRGYVAMADILDLMGTPDRGLALLDQAESAGLEPSWRVYFTRARLISDDKQTEKVLGLFETAMAFKDASRKAIAPYVVAVLQAEKNGADLINSLRTWNSKYPTPLFQLTLAMTEVEQKQFSSAEKLYTQLIEQDPSNREAKINKAIMLYRDLKRHEQAIALFHNVLDDKNYHPALNVRAMAHAHLAAAYLQTHKYQQAATNFRAAVAEDPQNATVFDFINKAYQGSPKQLTQLIEQLKNIVPGTGVLYALLGETLSMKLGEHRQALSAFSDAIVLEPDRSDYYNAMGLTYYRMKNYRDALKLFSMATEVDPNDASALYNEACALTLLGRSDDAIAKLAEAISLDPRLAASAQKDSDFTGLKSNSRFRELMANGPAALDLDVVGH